LSINALWSARNLARRHRHYWYTAYYTYPIPDKDIGYWHFLFISLIYNKDVLSHFRPSFRIFIRTKDDTVQYGFMRLSRHSIPRRLAIKRFVPFTLHGTTHPILTHLTSRIFSFYHFFPRIYWNFCYSRAGCMLITHHRCPHFFGPRKQKYWRVVKWPIQILSTLYIQIPGVI